MVLTDLFIANEFLFNFISDLELGVRLVIFQLPLISVDQLSTLYHVSFINLIIVEVLSVRNVLACILSHAEHPSRGGSAFMPFTAIFSLDTNWMSMLDGFEGLCISVTNIMQPARSSM